MLHRELRERLQPSVSYSVDDVMTRIAEDNVRRVAQSKLCAQKESQKDSSGGIAP